MWWSVHAPLQSAILTTEQLERAFKSVLQQSEEYRSPVIWMSAEMQHRYRCLLVRDYWKEAYREFRMFRTCCERGWLNGAYGP